MISVVINNYNYSNYICECINSVLLQQYKDIQLIIVDDGSTDNSLECIDQFCDSRITVIAKENHGQLSCFNAAIPHIKGNIVAFLDADDLFEKEYLAKLLYIYDSYDVDFVFTNYCRFGSCSQKYVMPNTDVLFPVTRVLTFLSKVWIGGPTSTLSMRFSLLRHLLPMYDIEQEWRTRADDILVWGASLCNAKKYYFHEQLIRYRTHQNNNFFNCKKLSSQEEEKRNRSVEKFFSKFSYLQKEISPSVILHEMIHSKLPIGYYVPYLIKNKLYFKIMQRLTNILRNRTKKSLYDQLII